MSPQLGPPYIDVRVAVPRIGVDELHRTFAATLVAIDMNPPASGPEVELIFGTPPGWEPLDEQEVVEMLQAPPLDLSVLASRVRNDGSGVPSYGERGEAQAAVVDFLDAWRFCPVSQATTESRRPCLEDAARQLLDLLTGSPAKVTKASDEMKVRALIGYLPGDSRPTFLGAADAGAWEVVDEEEWQRITLGWKKCWAGDWESYDYREVFLVFPASVELFKAPAINAVLQQAGEEERTLCEE